MAVEPKSSRRTVRKPKREKNTSESTMEAPSRNAGNQLTEAFVRDVLANWQSHGATTIESVRKERPHDYLKLVTTLFPKETFSKVNALDESTEEQLADQLAAVLAELAGAGVDPGPGTGATKAKEPAGNVSTLF